MKKLVVIAISVLIFYLVGVVRISTVFAAFGGINSSQPVSVSSFRDNTYYRKLQEWKAQYSVSTMSQQQFELVDFVGLNPHLTFTQKSISDPEYVAFLNKNDELFIQVNVAQTALYAIGFDFYIPEAFYSIPSIKLQINGKSLFNEASDLELPVAWEMIPLEENRRYNRYGNELLPDAESINEWTTYFADDYLSSSVGPYQFLLEAGDNTISIKALNTSLYIGAFHIKGSTALPSYQEYRQQVPINPTNAEKNMVIIEGESFDIKNDLEIKSSYYKEPSMTPYTHKFTVLNQLDGNSMSRGGMSVSYTFEIATTGDYQMAFKVLKGSNSGIASAKNIYIDGQILFQEISGYFFDSTKRWENVTLGINNQPFLFYLEAGVHTLTFESTTHPYADIMNRLNSMKDEISSISLLVKTITGGNKDDAIDWNILRYIPNLKQTLETFATELETIYEEINSLDQGLNVAAEVSTLNVAAKQLRRVAKLPNKIGSKLQEFSEGSGSSYQLIGNAISALMSSPLSVDRIYLYQGQELPFPTASFFARLWDGVKSFFYSFFDARYNDIGIDEDTLDVWVGQSSLYLDIIQSMIDQDFTTRTGIKVKASIMTNPAKIVLSNATNDNPDVVLSIDSWNPYAYALRGMLADLSKFPDFDEVTKHYYANNFTPVIFEDGVYGIPETQSVFLLFYRTDILNYLDISVPNTWQDVIHLLPILQSHQMNFFHPLGGDGAFKGYGFVSPLIYQMGGEIYSELGASSSLRDVKTIQSIQFMTDLFTVHNLPLQVSSFFEHFRSGSMPIGISTIDLYLQLKYAAPELSGQWGVSVIPGMFNEESGEVQRWSTTYGKTSILFDNSDKLTQGWELIKWWNSTQTQIKFMQNIKTSLGEKYLILSANMDALVSSVWENQIKEPIIAQAAWSRIPGITPGSYIVERELSSIWNKIVIERMNVSVAINESIPRVNRELARKFNEFGYYTSTNPSGKLYIVPMNSNISDWIKKDYTSDE
ncbi:MAG: extracellular solute-binding protein [bacterium]|nr:extracellular solute-binding protein [bacterium]